MTIYIDPASWLFNLYILSQNKTDSNLTSLQEIAFRLDSGASIPVPKTPIYMMNIECPMFVIIINMIHYKH